MALQTGTGATGETHSPGTVCFPGFAQREDLAVSMRSRKHWFCRRTATPGSGVNEAMRAASDHREQCGGCADDLVEDGWNVMCASRKLGETERAIDSLVRQPDLRQRMSAHSLERIRSYSPEACADGLAVATAGGKGSGELRETAAVGCIGLAWPGALLCLSQFPVLRTFLPGAVCCWR